MNAIPEHPTKKETCASKGFPKPKTPGVSKKVRQGVADMIFRKRNRENNNKSAVILAHRLSRMRLWFTKKKKEAGRFG